MGACASKPKVSKNEDIVAPENVEEAAATVLPVEVEVQKEMIDSPPQQVDEVITVQKTEAEVVVIKEAESNPGPGPDVEMEKTSSLINEVEDAKKSESETNLGTAEDEAETEKVSPVEVEKVPAGDKIETQNKNQGNENNPIASFFSSLMGQKR